MQIHELFSFSAKSLWRIVMGVAAAAFVPGSAIAGGYPLYVTNEPASDGVWRVVAVNKGPVPITVVPELTKAVNAKLQSDGKVIAGKVMEPGAKEILAQVQREKAGESVDFLVRLKWGYGRSTLRERNSQVAYVLPFPSDKSYDTINNASWRPVERMDQYVLDILMPEGTPVIASRAGIVTDVKGEAGGDRVRVGVQPYYETNPERIGNYVRVLHDDGTIAEYMSLAADSVLVTVGQQVEAGTQLGASGSSGQSTVPHLRMRVLKLSPSLDAPVAIQPEFNRGPYGIRPALVGQPLGMVQDYESSLASSTKDPLALGGGAPRRDPTQAAVKPPGVFQSVIEAGKSNPLLASNAAIVTLAAVWGIGFFAWKKRRKVASKTEAVAVAADETHMPDEEAAIPLETNLRPSPGALFSETEQNLMGYLRIAVPPNWMVLPKVSLHRLLARPTSLRREPDVYRALRWEAIDFVIVAEDKNRLIAAVDVEDGLPMSDDRKRLRDGKRQVLAQAGVPLVTIAATAGPESIRKVLLKQVPMSGFMLS